MTDLRLSGPNRLGNYIIFRSKTRQGIIVSETELGLLWKKIGSRHAISNVARPDENNGPAIKERYGNLPSDLFNWSINNEKNNPHSRIDNETKLSPSQAEIYHGDVDGDGELN